MSTKVYLASLMAKRFAGSPEKSEKCFSDILHPDKVNDFTLSGGTEQIQEKKLVMDEQWSPLQNHGLPTVRFKPTFFILRPWTTTCEEFEEVYVPLGGDANFFNFQNQIKQKLKRLGAFLCDAILTTTAYLCLSEPKANNLKQRSKSVATIKTKKSSYQVSAKYPNLTSSHVLNAYADFTHLCRFTALQTLERIKRESKSLLWISSIFENYDYNSFVDVLQNLSNLLLNSNHSSDPPNQKQGAILSSSKDIETEILSSASSRRTERTTFSNTQTNQNIDINTRNPSANSANTSERSTMDQMNQIIADELAALAGEVGDVFDGAFGRDNYFDEMNANLLREDSIDLPNLDELEESDFDFDPYEVEGGEYEDEEEEYGTWSLPRMSPSPFESHLRFLDDSRARDIANFDNQTILSHNNFSTESEDDVDSPNDPKRPRLSNPEQDPKSPPN